MLSPRFETTRFDKRAAQSASPRLVPWAKMATVKTKKRTSTPTSRRTVRLGWRRLRVDGGYVLTWLRLVWSAENYFKERKIILGTWKSISASQNIFPQFSGSKKKKKQHTTRDTKNTRNTDSTLCFLLFFVGLLVPPKGFAPMPKVPGPGTNRAPT